MILLSKMIQNPIFAIQMEPLHSLFRKYFISVTNQAAFGSKGNRLKIALK